VKALVIGSGGREHALAWKLAQGVRVDAVYVAPGNAGTALEPRLENVPITDLTKLAQFALDQKIDLTVVGPEAALAAGAVDIFRARGLRIFGPTKAAAELESSKAFAKAFMQRHAIPTAAYDVFDDAAAAHRHVDAAPLPIVVKADGLAAGKGVVVAADRDEAEDTIRAMMDDRQFGAAGARVVLEECLTGPEVSFFAVCDGQRAVAIGTAQDHKRIFDGDRGPNTGGMGAFAPSSLIDAELRARVQREIVDPVVRGMREEGHEYRGFLYAGLMLTPAGPQVIEFNVRLGDPEAQVVLARIAEPLLPLLVAAAAGRLQQSSVRSGADRVAGVVLASRGYPDTSESGQPIDGLDSAEAIPGVSVYHAGTAQRGGRVVTAGGRVLTVAGRGDDFAEAIARAYAGVHKISFDGMQFRHDIGRSALKSDRP